jgi:VanZ family protein
VRNRVLATVPFVIALALSGLVLFTPGSQVPEAPVGVDKLIHAGLFALLAFTGRTARIPERALAVALAGYALLSEVLQRVLPIDRDFALGDLAADLVGIVVGLWVADRLSRRRRGRRSPPTTR